MTWLFDLLRTPSAFEDAPRKYLRNQMAHGYLIGGLAALLLGPLVVIVAYALWEVVQIRLFRGRVWDGLEDLAFVSCIALAVLTWNPLFAVIHTLFLAAGYARRRDLSSQS